MHTELDVISSPIETELDVFNKKFISTLETDTPILKDMIIHILNQKGKRIRPLLVLLCSKLFGEISDKCYSGAIMIELLHTATLIHDDIIDEAEERRGMASLHVKWKSKLAVLAGDYLLSKGLAVAVENGSYEALNDGCKAVKDLIEGEMLQEDSACNMNISEDTYYKIISKKTATLFASSTANGAISGGAGKEEVEKLRLFGEYLGIAFQIQDDIFDFIPQPELGKPSGNDIREKKITLPLIYALNHTDNSTKEKLLGEIRNGDECAVEHSRLLVESTGGIGYAREVIRDFQKKALEILEQCPDNKAREALRYLTLFVSERTH